jgi:NADH:ubiquinone oxidoreductase subunit C
VEGKGAGRFAWGEQPNGAAAAPERRFAAVAHLLSVQHNRRVRLRTFADNDDLPVVASLTSVHPGVNWFEREAFDLYGIVFERPSGPAPHPDRLRFRRSSVPQGLPADRQRRGPLRRRQEARGL